MRAATVIVLVAALGVLLQTTVFHTLPFGQPGADVLLVLCVYLGLHHHTVGGVVGAFLLGYLQDSASGSPAGLNAFAMVAVFVLVYLTSRRLWMNNVVSKVVVVFLASLVKTVVVVGLLASFVRFDASWSGLLWGVLANAALAAVIAPPLFWLLASAGLVPDRRAG